MPRTASSRSADGATTAALLPPSSRIRRPKRDATTGRHGPAHARRAGGRHDGHALVGGERGADVGPALEHLVEPGRRADVGGRPPQQGVAGQRRQRRLVRRLPQHRVAGDEGQGGVPRPHGDGEVERRDDGARAHRVPRLHQPVARAARWRSSGRAAGGTARRRSRRCRSSPGPRRGPRSGSCRPRSTPARRASSLCSRSSSPRRRTRLPRTGAGVVRHVANASVARSTAASTSPASPAGAERAAGDRGAGAERRRTARRRRTRRGSRRPGRPARPVVGSAASRRTASDAERVGEDGQRGVGLGAA